MYDPDELTYEDFEGLDPLDLNCIPAQSNFIYWVAAAVCAAIVVASIWSMATVEDRTIVEPKNQDPRAGWVDADGQRFKCVGGAMVYATEVVFYDDPRCVIK